VPTTPLSPVAVCQNTLPYNFRGKMLSASGTYYDTLQTTKGCDSILSLVFTVKPVPTTNLSPIAVCQNTLPYNFNGKMLNTSGTYYDTLQTSLGCDSILSLVFTVNPVPTTPLSPVAVCQNTLPYNFNGKMLNTSGTYYDTLQTTKGCDSILSLVFTVNPTYIKSDTAVICQGNNYLYQGKNYAITGIYRDTLQTISGCDSIFELNLTVNPVYLTPISASICEGTTYLFAGEELTDAGIYYDTLQTIFGCDSVIELTLTVNSFLFTQISADICEGTTYSFAGEELSVAGIYYDTLQAIYGCDSIVELTLTVNPVYFTQISDSISAGSSYNFNGKNLTTDGVYYDTLQTLFGCDSIVKLTLKVTSVGIVGAYGIRPIQIYPNPTTGELRIKSDELRIGSVEIFDIVGQCVGAYRIRPENNEAIIDISHLSAGMYFLKVDGKVYKVVKE
jgi:hypothetical protein